MKHGLKKFLSALLAVLMLVSLCPAAAFAAGTTDFTATVESVNAVVGTSFDVKVSLSNNPGIAAYRLVLSYDSSLLTLDSVTYGDQMTPTTLENMNSPVKLVWYNATDVSYNGTVATLHFTVSDTLTKDTATTIGLTLDDVDDVNNSAGDTVDINLVSGNISIYMVRPGDINGDAKTNTKDLVRLAQYLAGWSVSVSSKTADVNGDGKVNTKDLVTLAQYLSGWSVTIYPIIEEVVCTHELTATEAVASTCVTQGNDAYWTCSKCGKLFSDAEGTSEISAIPTLALDPTNHENIVIDTAVAATTSSTGLTEGSHCAACTVVIKAQEVVPMLAEEHSITYNISNGDSYIAQQTVTNNNPATYATGTAVTLKNLSVDGYKFLGWYDGAGDNATQVKKIDAASSDDIELYAHWEAIVYTVQFNSDLYAVDSVTYTVDKGTVLPTPKLSNYVFVGWSDDFDSLYTRIPTGTTGNIILNANWTSERNKTWSKQQLDAPIIYEDTENNMIYFAYEIGEIQNVPLQTIKDFGYIAGDGITKTETVTYTEQTSTTEMSAYTTAVAQATTESSNWSLSSGWSDTSTVNSEWCEANNITEEEAIERGTTDEGNWNISNGTYGSSSQTTLSSNTRGLTNEVKVNRTTTDSQNVSETVKESDSVSAQLDFSEKIGVSATSSVENTATIAAKESVGVQGVASAEVSASDSLKTGLSTTVSSDTTIGTSTTSSHEDETSYSSESSHTKATGSEAGNTVENSTLNSSSTTNTAGWNSESSYGGSHTESVSESTSRSVGLEISNKTGYGASYIQSGDQSSTQGTTASSEMSDEYSSSVTYGKVTGETLTRTWTTQGTKPGYHRWVIAGTAHVFGIVAYDIAESAYSVFTYSIMDDETHDFEDYSYTDSSYSDNQNGVLPFDVPYDEIVNYVANRTSASDGLKVDMATGEITAYTGTDTAVIIPEYLTVDNGDGSHTVVTVTGISANAFRPVDKDGEPVPNTNIKAVVLPDTVTSIPEAAFKGCTSLIGVGGKSITSIGKDAFAGDINFYGAYISSAITSLGENAFEGVYSLYVNAANAEVAEAAIKSGADAVVLYLDNLNDGDGVNALSGKIEVPSDMLEFVLNGYGGTFNDTTLISNAKYTRINRANFASTTAIPLQINSSTVILNQVNASSNGTALVVDYNGASIRLQGTNVMTAANGNAVLMRNPTLSELNSSVVGKIQVNDKLLYCGSITGSEFVDGTVEEIDETTYQNLLTSCVLTLDPNGGECEAETVSVPNSTAIGSDALPTATRDYYDFAGWYTEAEGGTKITAASVFTVDTTLYAHWTVKQYTLNWNDCTGVNISVSRTSSPLENAATGELGKGSTVYYGDVLSISYSAVTGYTVAETGATSITVERDITGGDINGVANVNAYVMNVTASHATVSVTRTSSPLANASTGSLSSGATVYYGDVLYITYASNDSHYTMSRDPETITVTGDVSINAEAAANPYTYSIVCQSSNGTNLGTDTVTNSYGGTYTVSAPYKEGYDTPAAQSVAWDADSKTITFTYSPSSVDYVWKSAQWCSSPKMTYTAVLMYQNRTASSVQVRVHWISTIAANGLNDYGQQLKVTAGSTTKSYQIMACRTWSSSSSSERSVSATSDWITVSLSTTAATTVPISVYVYQFNSNGTDMTSYANYSCVKETWKVNIPAY